MIRYADDFVILCRTQEEAQEALEKVRRLATERGLTLHPERKRLVDVMRPKEGFDFLGYHCERNTRWPRAKSMKKLKDTIRSKTKRCNGQSMERIIQNVTRTLKGWFEYFKHSHRRTFEPIDAWIRRRLRSILRKRANLSGISRGRDHQRWPNQYFREYGLYSLAEAHISLSSPHEGTTDRRAGCGRPTRPVRREG